MERRQIACHVIVHRHLQTQCDWAFPLETSVPWST